MIKTPQFPRKEIGEGFLPNNYSGKAMARLSKARLCKVKIWQGKTLPFLGLHGQPVAPS